MTFPIRLLQPRQTIFQDKIRYDLLEDDSQAVTEGGLISVFSLGDDFGYNSKP